MVLRAKHNTSHGPTRHTTSSTISQDTWGEGDGGAGGGGVTYKDRS